MVDTTQPCSQPLPMRNARVKATDGPGQRPAIGRAKGLTPLLFGLTLSVLFTTTAFTATATAAESQPAAQKQQEKQQENNEFFRVELPLPQVNFRDTELSLQNLITQETYIDVSQFHLHAVEVVATTKAQGGVRLQVGRFITPVKPVAAETAGANSSAPDADTDPLFIQAPHRSQNQWQLVFEDQVAVYHLTAILAPQSSALASLSSRPPPGLDPNLGNDGFSRNDPFANDPFARDPFGRADPLGLSLIHI